MKNIIGKLLVLLFSAMTILSVAPTSILADKPDKVEKPTKPPKPPKGGKNSPPIADAGIDQNVILGDIVTFDGSGSFDPDGTIITYEWKEVDMILSTDVSFDKSDFSVGLHTITLTVTDNDGASASDNIIVTVAQLPDTTPPVITVLGNNPELVLQDSVYTDVGATAIDDRDGTISVIPTGSVDTSTVGVYMIVYTAIDSAGNSATANRTVNVERYWKYISAGERHSVAIKWDGTLWAWGSNGNGQLGDGTQTTRYVPTQEITQATDWVSVATGATYTIAIKSDGTLWAWGSNHYGELGVGDGTTTGRLIPTQEITGSTDWISVAAEVYHTLAIKSDGTLWAWGSNYYGELGDGTKTHKPIPTQEITGATDWVSVSTGYEHSIALKSDGTLWSWGANTFGQLADGTTRDSMVPTQEVTKSTDWMSISSGYNHSIAIKSDGTLWAWGLNGSGQLGDGTLGHRSIPTQSITEATDWIHISAGYYHTTAIKLDGTLWAWGANGSGQLGIGTTTLEPVPAQEATMAMDWVSVDAGGSHTTAIKSDGTLWAWGSDRYGQIGDGPSKEDNFIPLQIP